MLPSVPLPPAYALHYLLPACALHYCSLPSSSALLAAYAAALRVLLFHPQAEERIRQAAARERRRVEIYALNAVLARWVRMSHEGNV